MSTFVAPHFSADVSSRTSSYFMPMPPNPAVTAQEQSSDVSSPHTSALNTPSSGSSVIEPESDVEVVVAGALAVDFSCDYAPFAKTQGESIQDTRSNFCYNIMFVLIA